MTRLVACFFAGTRHMSLYHTTCVSPGDRVEIAFASASSGKTDSPRRVPLCQFVREAGRIKAYIYICVCVCGELLEKPGSKLWFGLQPVGFEDGPKNGEGSEVC